MPHLQEMHLFWICHSKLKYHMADLVSYASAVLTLSQRGQRNLHILIFCKCKLATPSSGKLVIAHGDVLSGGTYPSHFLFTVTTIFFFSSISSNITNESHTVPQPVLHLNNLEKTTLQDRSNSPQPAI